MVHRVHRGGRSVLLPNGEGEVACGFIKSHRTPTPATSPDSRNQRFFRDLDDELAVVVLGEQHLYTAFDETEMLADLGQETQELALQNQIGDVLGESTEVPPTQPRYYAVTAEITASFGYLDVSVVARREPKPRRSLIVEVVHGA